MTTLLPQDSNDNPIPALRLKQNGAHTVAISATSTRNTTAFSQETQIISLYCNSPTYIAFGDNSISASTSDHYFPAGVYYDISIGGEHSEHYTHVAVLQAESTGTLYISEKE